MIAHRHGETLLDEPCTTLQCTNATEPASPDQRLDATLVCKLRKDLIGDVVQGVAPPLPSASSCILESSRPCRCELGTARSGDVTAVQSSM